MNTIPISSPLYDLTAQSIDGELVPFSQFRGSVLLIVNVASQCVFTGQYSQLQLLYEEYRSRGLIVLGFPCNQFGSQESKSEKSIKDFCSLKYDVSFPMFAKIEVNGNHTHPIFALLKSKAKGILGSQNIKWNFTKFLVGRDGAVLGRFAPATSPASLTLAIEKALFISALD